MAAHIRLPPHRIASEGVNSVLPLYKIVEVRNPRSITTTDAPALSTVHFPALINCVSESPSVIALKYSFDIQAGRPCLTCAAEAVPAPATKPIDKQRRTSFFMTHRWLHVATIARIGKDLSTGELAESWAPARRSLCVHQQLVCVPALRTDTQCPCRWRRP